VPCVSALQGLRRATGLLVYLGPRRSIFYIVRFWDPGLKIKNPRITGLRKELCRNLSNPSHADMRAAKRVVQYLYTTRYDGLTFDRRSCSTPIGYADADFANQLSDRRSTTGKAILLYGSADVWSSRQQRTVALSTAEAEYYALCDLGRDIRWFRHATSF
jgi:hypothetical protein